MSRVAVVGAGISGLAAAWRLLRAEADVTVFEAAERAGGVVKTHRDDGWVFEGGPNTVQSTSAHLMALVSELGLDDQLVTAREAANRRLVWRGGRLHELPSGPGSFFGSSLLGFGAKLRAMTEPWRGAPKEPRDETLEAFFTRRIGRGATSAFVDPFVAGVFTGRVDELGADAFPALVAMEREHGSLLKGLKARRKARQEQGETRPLTLVSLQNGLAQLTGTIAERLGERLRTGARVTGLERGDGGWTVRLGDESERFDAVVLAVPAYVAADLLAPIAGDAAAFLGELSHPTVASVALGYPVEKVSHDLEAFGLLGHSDSPFPGGGPVLGLLFASSIFEGRAPEGQACLLVMMGGARYPEAAELSEDELIAGARAACEGVLGAEGEPTMVRPTVWRRAIPQYPPGHLRRVAALREALSGHAGLHVAGNWIEGVGMDASAGTGMAAAEGVLDRPRS